MTKNKKKEKKCKSTSHVFGLILRKLIFIASNPECKTLNIVGIILNKLVRKLLHFIESESSSTRNDLLLIEIQIVYNVNSIGFSYFQS